MMECNVCSKEGPIWCICPDCAEELTKELADIKVHFTTCNQLRKEQLKRTADLKKQLAERELQSHQHAMDLANQVVEQEKQLAESEKDLDNVEDHAIALGKKLGKAEFEAKALEKQLAGDEYVLGMMSPFFNRLADEGIVIAADCKDALAAFLDLKAVNDE